MAIVQFSQPLELGVGIFGCTSSFRRSVGFNQIRLGVKIYDCQEKFWARGSSWSGPLHLQAFGNGEIALVGSAVGRRGNVASLGGENQKHLKTFVNNAIIFGLLTRLYRQHQDRIASSSRSFSSSSSLRSSKVGAALGRAEGLELFGEDGKPTKLESQSSSGGWESEQDFAEAEFAEKDHRSRGIFNGNPRESLREENGRLDGEIVVDTGADIWERPIESSSSNCNSSFSSSSTATSGPPSVGLKEPVYEVIDVCQSGDRLKKLVSRRQLLRTSGLRLRDLRRVDPSLWVTNSAPALLVRDEAILLNLGSLRAIATTEEVLIFDHQSVGAKAFIDTLIPRLIDRNNTSGTIMSFELEVIEAALISRTQRLEKGLMDVEPRVLTLLEVLPTCMTADVLEDLRVSKQALVEVGAKAGALRQMLLELLEHPQDIRRMVVMGRICRIHKEDGSVECDVAQDKQVAEDEEEEMEMLLEYYLQRCESCHGQALKLLSSAKEMEDSIAVNLSSRRLEVSRVELLLQVGTFCTALGALIAGIFGMNLKSYLEEHVLAFWITTAAIIFGGISLFIYMFSYLSNRKIL